MFLHSYSWPRLFLFVPSSQSRETMCCSRPPAPPPPVSGLALFAIAFDYDTVLLGPQSNCACPLAQSSCGCISNRLLDYRCLWMCPMLVFSRAQVAHPDPTTSLLVSAGTPARILRRGDTPNHSEDTEHEVADQGDATKRRASLTGGCVLGTWSAFLISRPSRGLKKK